MNKQFQLMQAWQAEPLLVQLDLSQPIQQVEKMLSLLLNNQIKVISFKVSNEESIGQISRLQQLNKQRALIGVHGLMDDYQARLVLNQSIDFISSNPYSESIQPLANRQGAPYLAMCETYHDLASARELGSHFIMPLNAHLMEADQYLMGAYVIMNDLQDNPSQDNNTFQQIRLVTLKDLSDNQLKSNLKTSLKGRSQTPPSGKDVSQAVGSHSNLSVEEVNRLIQMIQSSNQPS